MRGEVSRRWSAAAAADGSITVAFKTDRVDPDSDGPLVYRFRVANGQVTGANLAGRTILQEP